MTGKERAALRAEAHHLDATVHVGHQGLTPSLLASLDDALRTRELVKVKLAKQAEVKAKDAANALALATGAAVIQVIGSTTTLYRKNEELKSRPGDLPAWRR